MKKYRFSFEWEEGQPRKECTQELMNAAFFVEYLESIGCHDIEVEELPEENIRVLVVEPGKDPEVRVVENSLEGIQQIVQGYIECVTLRDKAGEELVLICNEEGKIRNLQMNVIIPEIDDMIFGTFLIAGTDRDELASLTDEQIFEMNERFMLNGRDEE